MTISDVKLRFEGFKVSQTCETNLLLLLDGDPFVLVRQDLEHKENLSVGTGLICPIVIDNENGIAYYSSGAIEQINLEKCSSEQFSLPPQFNINMAKAGEALKRIPPEMRDNLLRPQYYWMMQLIQEGKYLVGLAHTPDSQSKIAIISTNDKSMRSFSVEGYTASMKCASNGEYVIQPEHKQGPRVLDLSGNLLCQLSSLKCAKEWLSNNNFFVTASINSDGSEIALAGTKSGLALWSPKRDSFEVIEHHGAANPAWNHQNQGIWYMRTNSQLWFTDLSEPPKKIAYIYPQSSQSNPFGYTTAPVLSPCGSFLYFQLSHRFDNDTNVHYAISANLEEKTYSMVEGMFHHNVAWIAWTGKGATQQSGGGRHRRDGR